MDLIQRRGELLKFLTESAYRQGDFKLASGKKSNHYVNCKPVSLNSNGLSLISYLLLNKVESGVHVVAGLTLGADPLVSGVIMAAHEQGLKMDGLIVRKATKGYGTNSRIEGPSIPKGTLVTVLEDVVTTGGSSSQVVDELRRKGFIVNTVLCIVDREEGGKELFQKSKINLISLFSIKELIASYGNVN
tara:strand:+ start:4732 stop:5298 length:567 start_codon:yes stop_codon:yes gene_type:complete